MSKWTAFLRDESLPRRMKERPDLVIIALALVYYVFRLVCYAFWLHAYVPPDEVDLFARVQFFSETAFIPADTSETAVHGLIGHSPFLYFWVMGKLLLLNIFPVSDLVFIRLANVPLAIATVLYAYRLIGLFTENRIARVLLVIVLTNTLQLTTLSASVTYDNLATLLGVAGSYYLLRLFSDWHVTTALKFGLALALGCLTKIPFLPVAGVLGIALIIRRRKTLRRDLVETARVLRRPSKTQVALLVPLAICVALCAEMHLGNLVRYGTLTPQATDMLPLEDALRYRHARRNWVIQEFKSGRLTWDQALAEVAKIQNRGNRNRTELLLHRAREPELVEASRVGRDTYAFLWTQIMIDRIVGYQGNGDKVMTLGRGVSYIVFGLMIACLLLFVRRAKVSDADGVPWYAFWICLAYAMLLMWTVTYPIYIEFGSIDNYVNGRYWFPLLPLLYCIGARYGLASHSRRVQLAIAVAVSAFFIYTDLPTFAANLSRCWFTGAEAYPECVY